MSIYVSTTVLEDGAQVSETVDALLERGIKNIELGSTHAPEADLLKKLKQRSAHYITHNFFPPNEERPVLNLASVDEKIRKQSVDFMKKAIDFAVELGAPIYTFHPGFLIDPVSEGRTEGSYDFKFPDQTSATEKQYTICSDYFLNAVEELARHIKGKKISIALETQGSLQKKEFVLFSRPQDYEQFLERIPHMQVGVNLNFGHLILASKAWGFDLKEAIHLLGPRIIAAEVSHNEGVRDDHQALKRGTWYLDILKNKEFSRFFSSAPVIFEGRCLSDEAILDSYSILKETLGGS